MKREVVFTVGGVLMLGVLGASVLGQVQDKSKPKVAPKSAAKSASRTATVPSKAKALGKATALGAPPEDIAAERALYAEADRLEMEARALLRSGDLDGAERTARLALAATPDMHGEQRPRHTIPLLLGDICLRQGRYEEALGYYLPAGQTTWRSGLDLDVALCYARLGNWPMARRFYSDQALLQYSSIKPGDLPGTTTPQSLEASILLAHGMDAFLSARDQESLSDFDAAGKLAPNNGLVAYYGGMSLLNMNRSDEAAPYFRRAAQYGRGKILEMAQGRAVAYPKSTTAPPQAPQ